MFKNHKLIINLLGLLTLFAIFIGISQNANAQCSYCTASTSYQDEYIGRVVFAGINNPSSGNNGFSYGVADFTNHVAYVKPGNTYTIEVWNGGYAYSSDYVRVFFDWNNDCDFDDANEAFNVSQSGTPAGSYFKQDIQIPTGITPGNKRMRVRMTYASTPQPCGSSSYGEVEDYTVYVMGAPDAYVDAIITPTYPYPEGTYNVYMRLGNLGDANLASCTINWSVNGVNKPSVNWSGNLAKNNTVQILLGSHAFVYPDGGPYTPFTITVWLTNIVGVGTTDPDADPSNNSRTVQTAPATEDAAPIAIVSPSGSFTPGLKDITVRITNLARKPLTVVDIDWYVDGVKRGTRKWFGSLLQNQTADVVVGQFDFQFKTPLAPYEIKVVTINPNGVADPNQSNDTYIDYKAPSLVAGTYTIGGSNAHFPTFASAAQYLSSSGIIGSGPVIFNINSGTYNEQVTLNDFANSGNTFIFQSATGFASDVRINATTNTSNWAVGINGLDNVTFRNLTIQVSKGTAAGAQAIWASGAENLILENVVLTGVSNPTRDPLFSVVFLNGINNFSFTNSTINGGSYGVYFNAPSSVNYTFKDLKLYNYNTYGIYHNLTGGGIAQEEKNKDNTIQSTYNLYVENNEFIGQTIPGFGGVYLQGKSKVSNNTFVNFNSTTAGNSVIAINAPTLSGSLVDNNSISNATGVTGIGIISNTSKVWKNDVSITSGNYTVAAIYTRGQNNGIAYNKVVASGNTTSYGVVAENSVGGIFANNLVNTTGPMAIGALNNNGTGFYYNTFAATTTASAALFSSGSNIFKRNLVMNYGTGRSVNNSLSNIQSANNNFFTKGATNASDLTAWVNSTNDNSSTNINIQLTDDGTYQYSQFVESSVNYEPLGIGDEYELYDYNGLKRDGFYYAGYAGIILEITILKQPQAILACAGEVNRQLELAATITYGANAKYQWYKDGNPIPGATNPVYKFSVFNYETTGNYKCLVYGPANTASGVFTNEVLVYTLRPTEIVKQPTKLQAKLGGTVFFEIEAHTKGITPPLFQHRYQWYRRYNGQDVQLVDNENYAGTRSPIMTITKLQDKHFTGVVDDYYFVEVEGQCGKVRSKPITLEMIASEVVFTEQPSKTNACIGNIVKFKSRAEVPGSNEAIEYQWYKDGSELKDDARITGTNKSELTIANINPNDEGEYYVVAKAPLSGTSKTSEKAKLTINTLPVFDTDPSDVTVNENETITLTAEASGTEPISYQWYKDDKPIEGANNKVLTIQSAELGHSGFYFCEASNICGKTKSAIAQVIVQKTGGVTSVTENDAFAMTITPNPANSFINLTLTIENDGQLEISILDVIGRTVYTTNKHATIGTNNISLDLSTIVANGTYFVKVTNGNQSSIKQIVITR